MEELMNAELTQVLAVIAETIEGTLLGEFDTRLTVRRLSNGQWTASLDGTEGDLRAVADSLPIVLFELVNLIEDQEGF